jgi:Methyltransferase domain
MKRLLSKALPAGVKARLRPYLDPWKARHLASTSKRLDICAAQLAHVLHLAGRPCLADKVCLEIGAGWVLSHSIVFHLLGAKKVMAVDIQPLAHPDCLWTAVHDSIPHMLPDILSPFADYALVRSRVENLFSIKRFDFKVLREIGIEYVSPLDLARDRLGMPVDFIYSNSVLEHVPKRDVPALLGNLVSDLSPAGAMIHCVHLEDHNDFNRRPFDFLTLPASEYPPWRETSTGNRMRASSWQKHFAALDGSRSRLLYSFSRTDVDLPPHIDESIAHRDKADLRTSHIGVLTQTSAAPCAQPHLIEPQYHEDACHFV